MLRRAVLLALVLSCVVACDRSTSDVHPTAPPTSAATASRDLAPVAQAYLDEALTIMQQHSINRHSIEWDGLRTSVYAHARGARTPADTYPAISYAVTLLYDLHSRFYPPSEAAKLRTGLQNASSPEPRGELVASKLGYVVVPSFLAVSVLDDKSTAFASRLQQIIVDLDARTPCGWIIDLRENRGGNMWPVVAGMGPLLGEGRLGAAVDPDGKEKVWSYRNGQALLDNTVLAQVTGPAYRLKAPVPPVAVLIGASTASSGEGIAIAFRGRPQTRSFGAPTMGLTTGNNPHELSDGAILNLAETSAADRTGHTYTGPIVPDQVVEAQQSGEDTVLQAAIAWLKSQAACAAG